MSDILRPEEVDELRPANEPKHLMMGTNTWRLIRTIGALAEALRAADQLIGLVEDEATNYASTELGVYRGNCARVAAWLEET
jgi:hypothetical protein